MFPAALPLPFPSVSQNPLFLIIVTLFSLCNAYGQLFCYASVLSQNPMKELCQKHKTVILRQAKLLNCVCKGALK